MTQLFSHLRVSSEYSISQGLLTVNQIVDNVKFESPKNLNHEITPKMTSKSTEFIKENLKLIFYGLYPSEELWRINSMYFILLVCGIYILIPNFVKK